MLHSRDTMLLITFAYLFQIEAVCFIPTISSSPLKVIDYQQSITEVQCKLDCLKNAECIGISYFAITTKCMLHGPLIGSCATPFEYLARSETGCTKGDVTANYVPSSCFASALLQPEYLISEGFPICPGFPVEGEQYGRLWVISVIFPNGTYRSFANDRVLEMAWDASRSSFVVRFIRNGVTFIDEPVYAATCAFFPDDASNTCPCLPLPIETTAAAGYADVLPYRLEPLSICPTGYIYCKGHVSQEPQNLRLHHSDVRAMSGGTVDPIVPAHCGTVQFV